MTLTISLCFILCSNLFADAVKIYDRSVNPVDVIFSYDGDFNVDFSSRLELKMVVRNRDPIPLKQPIFAQYGYGVLEGVVDSLDTWGRFKGLEFSLTDEAYNNGDKMSLFLIEATLGDKVLTCLYDGSGKELSKDSGTKSVTCKRSGKWWRFVTVILEVGNDEVDKSLFNVYPLNPDIKEYDYTYHMSETTTENGTSVMLTLRYPFKEQIQGVLIQLSGKAIAANERLDIKRVEIIDDGKPTTFCNLDQTLKPGIATDTFCNPSGDHAALTVTVELDAVYLDRNIDVIANFNDGYYKFKLDNTLKREGDFVTKSFYVSKYDDSELVDVSVIFSMTDEDYAAGVSAEINSVEVTRDKGGEVSKTFDPPLSLGKPADRVTIIKL